MSREGLQGFLALVALTQGLLPIGLRVAGSDGGPVWCLPQHLGTPGWWLVAIPLLVAAGGAVLALDR